MELFTMEENIIEKLKRILLADPEVKDKLKDLTSITSVADALKTFKLLYFFIKKLVYVVELIQAEFGGMEKEQKVEVAAALLDDLIKFSGWAIFIETFDYLIFKLLISQVVAALDDRYGSESWFKNVDANSSIDYNNILISGVTKEFPPEEEKTGSGDTQE